MSQEKRKSENYQNFGGINSKASQYVTGPTEFLDLRNMDFQTPGALTSRWGSTQYIGPTYGASVPIQSLFEFEQLNGFSQVVFSFSGSILAGATTGAHQGISFAVIGVTTPFFALRQIEFSQHDNLGNPTDFASFFLDTSFVFQDGTFASTFVINPEVLGQNKLDSLNFVNTSFHGSNSNFFKYNGSVENKLSLPGGTVASMIVSPGISGLFLPNGYKYYFAASYVNNRGYEGPMWPITGALTLDSQWGYVGSSLAASASFGTSFVMMTATINTPLPYGISSVNIWVYQSAGSSATPIRGASLWDLSFRFFANVPATGSSLLTTYLGTTAGGVSSIMTGILPPLNNYSVLGLRQTLNLTPATGPSSGVYYATLTIIDSVSPQCMEIYSNRLFYSGVTSAQSTFYYSDIGEPEGYAPEWNIEARTNDGDVVRALKSYNSRLYVFKENSFHELSGDNPDNFVLKEISDQYGCLSNRATVSFDDLMMFLDKKGICEFNGANTQIISNKIQPIFDRMNISAARGNATAIHDRQRNQVIFGIPVDGSATNNFTIVYDYLVKAWTTYDGYNPSVYAMVKGSRGVKTPMMGNNSGQIMFFGPSLMGDMGTTGAISFTCIVKTRMLAEAGNSTQKQYRRLYLDTNVAGTTSAITVKFTQDHGSSIVLTRTMYKDKFQGRIDYGLSARAIALQIESADASNPLTLNGFTIEYRIQRVV